MGLFSGENLGLSSLNPVAIGSTLVSGGLDYIGQREANETNLTTAREQMQFQERMSNTAHQREVMDLRNAGLNPVLSANSSGASTPQGASGKVENVFSGLQPAISSALEATRLYQDIKESDSRIELNRSSGRRSESDVDLKKGGWTGKVFGTSVSNFIRNVLGRGFNTAKQSFGNFLKEQDRKSEREKDSPRGKNVPLWGPDRGSHFEGWR